MAFGLPDPTAIERLADEHRRAWRDLAATTAAVATLPVRTLAMLAGLEPTPPEAAPAADPLLVERDRRLAAEAERARAEATIAALREDYEALERMLERRITLALADQKLSFYRQIEPLLTQLPVVRHALDTGRPVEAADVLALLSPLDTALAGWGLQAIAEVGAEAPFDPSLHQATGRAPEPGAPVRVKHVGYRLGDQILRRARVSVLKKAES